MTASPTSAVDRGAGSPAPRAARSAETAAVTRAAASGRPRWSSRSETERIAAVGSAFCWPAMSGADPCTGSNMLGNAPVGLTLPDAARPMPPEIAAARSVMMSPNRLSETMTSKRDGSVTRKIMVASTCR